MSTPLRSTEDPAAPAALAALVRGARRAGPTVEELAAIDLGVRATPHPRGDPGAPSPAAARWASRGLVSAVIVAGAAYLGLRGRPRPSPPSSPASTVAIARAAEPSPHPGSGAAAAPTPAPEPATAAPARAPAPPRPCVSREHIAAVESARRALAANDPRGALAAVTRDRTRCPRGELSEERDRLEIQALARDGRRAEARRRLDRFAQAYPDSLHLLALRGLIDDPHTAPVDSRP